MTKKWVLLVCVFVLHAAPSLWAQAPGFNPSARPTFSPWLNLNRRGTSSALNYYGIIRPQVNFTSSIQQLQRDVALPQAQQPTTGAGELPPTGHVAGFLNHGKYFMNRGGATGSRAPASSTVTAQPPAARRGR